MENLILEVWFPIKGFSNYMASNLGNIKSINYKRSGKTQILKPHDTGGYLQTMLKSDNGKYMTVKVHKIVTLAFLGERQKQQEVNHIDGNKHNNNISNLEYCSHSDNIKHAYDNGLQNPVCGINNGKSKLTDDMVREIREAKARNGRYWGRNEIAKKYNVSPKHLQDIANNHNLWKTVLI